MRITLIVVCSVIAAGSIALVSAQASRAETMLEAAKKLDVVDGNCAAAIKQYQSVVDTFARTERRIAATALVRMADCHARLGRAEARTIYERVVSEYADQSEAVAAARAKLGTNAREGRTGIVTRQVWETGHDGRGLGSVSADGRYVSFHHSPTGHLFLHDISTGKDRRLTDSNNSDGYPGSSIFSPDGRQVAYAWGDAGRHQLRTIDIGGTGFGAARVLFENTDGPKTGSVSVRPMAWSGDGKWIAAGVTRLDQTIQIVLIAPVDRSIRVLKSLTWREFGRMAFSPNSRYLAFSSATDQSGPRLDVFALAIDGSREIPVVTHPADDQLLGWTPDGAYILVNSDRTGSKDLWAVPLQNEVPGAPVLLKRGLGDVTPLGMAPSGAFYFTQVGKGPDIYSASVDFETGSLIKRPALAVQEFEQSNRGGAWSLDGKYLAYRSGDRLAIRSLDTGSTRYVTPDLLYWYSGGWSPDGHFNLTQGTDRKGRQGIYLIDVRTGAVRTIAHHPPHVSWWPRWSNDGKKIFYAYGSSGSPHIVVEHVVQSGQEREIARHSDMRWWWTDGNRAFYSTRSTVVERDLASGSERDLLRKEALFRVSAAPDGGHLAVASTDPATRESTLVLLPLTGGEPREVIRLADPARFRPFLGWTPDGRTVLWQTMPSLWEPKSELWRAPVAGARAQKIDLGVSDLSDASVHPDGRQLVFASTYVNQVSVLENYLPMSKPGK